MNSALLLRLTSYALLFACVQSWFGVAAAQGAAGSEGYALIVGISRFADPAISAMPGMEHDIAQARAIAGYIGIRGPGVTVLSDQRATKQAVLTTIERIARQVGAHEKVFLYFSTHGSRWTNTDTGACDESLVFYDGEHITKGELAAALKPIAQKAHKLFVFLDSCHSGGFAVTRSVGTRFVPKFHPNPQARDRCEIAINDFADAVSPVPSRTRSIAPNNVVVVTAARENEYALHREDIGGLATHAWARCALGKAIDLDRSGAVSFGEVEACAQREIEAQLAGVREYKPHHIVTQGVRALPLSLLTAAPVLAPVAVAPEPPKKIAVVPPAAQKTPPQEIAVVPPAAQKTPPQQIAIAPPAAQKTPPQESPPPVEQVAKPDLPLRPDKPPPAAPVKQQSKEPPGVAVGPAATLQDIVAMSDGRWELDVQVPNPRLQIQKDFLALRVRSQHAGFVYMLAVGSDNKTVDILFPNRLDGRNTIRAGEELSIPRLTWRLRAQGPVGTNRILIVVAETERGLQTGSFEDLAGVFLRSRPDQSNALQRGLYSSAGDGSGKCKALDARGAIVEMPCTPRFAARLVEVQEVATP